MLEHVMNLRFDDASQGKRRQIPFREKIDAAGFDALGGTASAEFAEEENLVDVMLNRRMIVLVAIVDRSQLFHDDVETRFLFYFAYGGETWRIADVGPSAGESPQSVGALFHEQDFVVFEHGGADVDFRSGVAFLEFELLEYGRGFVQAGSGGHDFGGDGAKFVVALLVVGVFAVREAVLRERLQAARPFEPAEVFLHIGWLSGSCALEFRLGFAFRGYTPHVFPKSE